MNRRSFFFLSAAAAGAVPARPQAAAPSDQAAIGFIGVGGRGRGLLRGFSALPDARVAAICDADQASLERAQATLDQAGVARPKAVEDMRRLFDDPSLDAVVVATPDHWHAPATILACDSGKDVYVEKPASHNIREGRLMVDAARRNGRIVQLGTQSRSKRWIVEAIGRIHSGEIGTVRMAKAWDVQLRRDIGHKENSPVPEGVDYELYLGPTTWIPFNENRFHYNWHWHWHFGTGDAGNDGVHQIDVARWALQAEAPTVVSGMGKKIHFDDDQQTPDTMNVTFDYGDGKLLQWEMRIWNPYGMEGVDNGVAVYGTEGMVHIGRWGRQEGYRIFDRDGAVHERVDGDGSDTHARNFLDSIKSRKHPVADIGEGHLSSLHAHLANIVARADETVRFDSETERVVAPGAANRFVSRAYRRHWATPAGV